MSDWPRRSARQAGGRRSSAAASRASKKFNPDYTHVKRDLRRIGYLTAFFLSILVILTFFLR